MSTDTLTQPWLVVIDMQTAFADPDSVWGIPDYGTIEPVVSELCERFAGRTVITRFVPDPEEPGQWEAYYDRWHSMRCSANSPLWNVTIPVRPGTPVVTLPTFSKWGDQLDRITAGAPLTICGVATDCCVLSTALGAVDAGRAVTVVSDACAGVSEEHHRATLALLDLLSPMIEIRSASELIGNTVRSG
ncbi:cysteine hydrolase family protein [Streptomyces malaysiensis]|uniref:cysteine hydrolase family protein n=1 Tax=Streptomyces malaysiensis TaxID=92644 RepID=UPI003724199F